MEENLSQINEGENNPYINPVEMGNKAVKNFFKNAFIFGLIFSGIFILLNLLYYITNINIYNFVYSIPILLITIILVILANSFGIKNYRDKYLGGKINYGKAFLQGLSIGFVALFISGVFNLIFFLVFDPDFMTNMLNEFTQSLSEKGVPEEQLIKIRENIEDGQKPLKQLLGIFINPIIFSAIISLIVSAFIRKKDKSLSQEVY